MARRLVTLMSIAAMLLVGCSTFVAANGKEDVILVVGKVLCQDCSLSYKEWASGSKPIKGSKVSLTCMDERKRPMHYTSDETDEKGQFELNLSKTIYGKELKPHLCTFRLVSSPDKSCNTPTDFADGQKGVHLSRPTSMYRDEIKYDLGSFFYTTPMCKKPDTSEVGSHY